MELKYWQLMRRVVSSFKKSFNEEQKSTFNLVKIHAMKHFSSSIRHSSTSLKYNTNMYKQLHISLMKQAYCSSNRRDYTR
jgi:hypothetical protein